MSLRCCYQRICMYFASLGFVKSIYAHVYPQHVCQQTMQKVVTEGVLVCCVFLQSQVPPQFQRLILMLLINVNCFP